MAKMIGKASHEPQCDCNIEQYVSGKGEQSSYRYGNRRGRSREKR